MWFWLWIGWIPGIVAAAEVSVGVVQVKTDLRSGPGQQFRSKGRLAPGDSLRILESVEAWVNVRVLNGAEGWVPVSAVQVVGGAGRRVETRTMDRVLIPAGEFVMGSDKGDVDERPVRRVVLDAYWIDRYEVTNGQYEAFRRATGHRAPLYVDDPRFGGADRPVVGVSWADAVAYCRWVGKRLPTEAEWERAARGFEGRLYPWGDVFDGARLNWRGHADYARDPDAAVDGYAHTAPVGRYADGASPEGVHDLLGNVWEWCADWYREDAYGDAQTHNPTGPAEGHSRVLRGGAWIDYQSHLRATNRMRAFPSLRHMDIGFRCVETP